MEDEYHESVHQLLIGVVELACFGTSHQILGILFNNGTNDIDVPPAVGTAIVLMILRSITCRHAIEISESCMIHVAWSEDGVRQPPFRLIVFRILFIACFPALIRARYHSVPNVCIGNLRPWLTMWRPMCCFVAARDAGKKRPSPPSSKFVQSV